MSLDPARAALVMNGYRYAIREDASIKALYPNATEYVFETALDSTSGTNLANSLFTLTGTPAKIFECVIEGVLYPEDFQGGMNRFVLFAPRHPSSNGVTLTLIKAVVDYAGGLTTLTLRG